MALTVEPTGIEEMNPRSAPQGGGDEPWGCLVWTIVLIPWYLVAKFVHDQKEKPRIDYIEKMWETWEGYRTERFKYLSGLPELPSADYVTLMATRPGMRIFTDTHTVLLPWAKINVAVGRREFESSYFDHVTEQQIMERVSNEDDLSIAYVEGDLQRAIYFRAFEEMEAHAWRDVVIDAQHRYG